MKWPTAANGEEGLAKARALLPDLIVLDVLLPDLAAWRSASCQGEAHQPDPDHHGHSQGREIDRVLGLELAADDYVTKPFSTRELVLRSRVCSAADRRAEVQG